MVIMSMFLWWYSSGLLGQFKRIKSMLARINDQFSIPLLLKTLFQPFRQISAERVDGAIEDRIRAWFDKLISRLIGGFIRTVVMIVGIVCLLLALVLSLLRIIFWILAPVIPFGGFAIASVVGLPWM
jgi:hypothetical protein